jgi:probable rRNA maturation factor
MPTIKNLQKEIRLPISKLEKITKKINKIIGLKKDYCIVITNDSSIRRLNNKFLHKNNPTDVIAFDYKENKYLGDIVISCETAKANAEVFKNTLLKELALYIIHGILHLKGYDDLKLKDRILMRKEEARILNKLFK